MNGQVQEASVFFFLPIVLAYLTACASWFALTNLRPDLWPTVPETSSNRPRLDLALALGAAVLILALGQAYRGGMLIPSRGTVPVRRVVWIINNLIIYSPIFLVMLFRRQPLVTVYLSPQRLWFKIGFGALVGVLCVALFLGVRGELIQLPVVLLSAGDGKRLTDFVPVFLEGVAMAFLLVRMRWAVGPWPAVVLPALLFAAAHIPSEMAEGRSVAEIIAFFVLNSVLVTAILTIVLRTRDIVWLGVVHYFLDIAIKAI